MSKLIPFSDVFDMFNVFDDFLFPTRRAPAMDVYEKDGTTGLEMEMPGIDPKDVEISVDRGILFIKYDKKEEKEQKDKKYHYVERSRKSYSRSFVLPEGTKEDEIVADYKDGILSITIPKLLKENKTKQIPIKT